MSDDYAITIEDDRTAWPEDMDPVRAADQLIDRHDDPQASLIQLLRTLPTTVGAAPTPIADGSRMAEDQAAAQDLLNLPMLCHNYLAGSADFLKGLYRLMRPRAKALEIPRFATYPLIRGVIESSGQTVWLLAPRERRDRFLRLLKLEKSEMDYDRRYMKVATVLHEDDTHERRSRMNEALREAEQARRARWKRLCDGAALLDIDKSEFERGLDGGYEAIVSEAMAVMHDRDLGGQAAGSESHHVGRFSASVWVFISGMSHPSMSRGWAGSLHEPGEIGADGYMRVTSSANPAIVRDALALALRLHMRALRLWAEASGAPWRIDTSG